MDTENKKTEENKTFDSITEAYDAGKRAGLLEGYIRATENIKSVIPQLQEKFLMRFNKPTDKTENE